MSQLIRPAVLRKPDGNIERHSTWLELFFDLVFVVIITELGTRLSHQFTYLGALQCCALFIPVMWTWNSYTVFAARFDNNDVVHWILTFVIMFAGIIMAIQIPVALESGALGFSIGFLIAECSLLLLYARVFFDDSTPKNMAWLYLLGYGSGAFLWIVSLFFAVPTKFIFWFFGMLIYLAIPWLGRRRILSRVPLDTVYIPERFGLFTIIVVGQTIASVVVGLKLAHWNFYAIVTSIMAFILAIIIWGQYYRFTKVADYKCTLSSGQPYIYLHVPLIIGMIIMGVGAEYFIKNPLELNQQIKNIFAGATITYLTSFYWLQYLTIYKIKIRVLSYLFGIVAILILFLSNYFPPYLALSGLVAIFTLLFSIQYVLGTKIQEQRMKK